MYAEHHLEFPLKNDSVYNQIALGDTVFIDGIIVTGRDLAHKYFLEQMHQEKHIFNALKPYLHHGAIYHCGPIIDLLTKKVIAAGPTTSMREEPYQCEVLSLFQIKAIIGKGGMGEKTLSCLQKSKALYLSAVGGAGSYYAKQLKVMDVFKLEEFGMPEAIWILEAKNFHTTVTMDFSSNSIHKQIESQSKKQLQQFICQ
jgi:fumarate hydratase class I